MNFLPVDSLLLACVCVCGRVLVCRHPSLSVPVWCVLCSTSRFYSWCVTIDLLFGSLSLSFISLLPCIVSSLFFSARAVSSCVFSLAVLLSCVCVWCAGVCSSSGHLLRLLFPFTRLQIVCPVSLVLNCLAALCRPSPVATGLL